MLLLDQIRLLLIEAAWLTLLIIADKAVLSAKRGIYAQLVPRLLRQILMHQAQILIGQFS